MFKLLVLLFVMKLYARNDIFRHGRNSPIVQNGTEKTENL